MGQYDDNSKSVQYTVYDKFCKKITQNDILGQTAMDPNLRAVTVEIQFWDIANSQNQNII